MKRKNIISTICFCIPREQLTVHACTVSGNILFRQHIKVMGRGSSCCDPWPIQNCDPLDPLTNDPLTHCLLCLATVRLRQRSLSSQSLGKYWQLNQNNQNLSHAATQNLAFWNLCQWVAKLLDALEQKLNWTAPWKNQICFTTMKLRKSLVKSVVWQKTCNNIELFGSAARDRYARRCI